MAFPSADGSPPTLRTNGLVELLHQRATAELQSLQDKHPNAGELLELGVSFGPEQEEDARSQDALADLTIKSLQTVIAQTEPTAGRLRQRLKVAGRVRLLSAVTTLAMSALTGVLAAMDGAPDSGSIEPVVITAALTFVAAVLTLYGEHLEKSLFGGATSLPDLLEQLHVLQGNAEAALREIRVLQITNGLGEEFLGVVRSANQTAVDLLVLQKKIGL